MTSVIGDKATPRESRVAEARLLARCGEFVALAMFTVLYFSVERGATAWVLVVNLAAFYVIFIRAIALRDRILPWLPTYFSIEVLFFVFSYVIFYFPYQLSLLGETDLAKSRFISNTFVEGTNQAITLTTVGMLAFTMGYRAISNTTSRAENREASQRHSDESRRGRSSQYFFLMSSASCAVLLALVAAYTLSGWRSAGEGRYTRSTTTQVVGVEGISVAILMCCMILGALWVCATASGLRKPATLWLGLVVSTGWTLRLLVLGDRNSFLLFALVLAGGYFAFVRRAPLALIAAGLYVCLFIYNAIEILRFTPNWYRSGNILSILFDTQAPQSANHESSFSLTAVTLRATVEAVPDPHEFMLGIFKLIQVSTIIPFSGKLFIPHLHTDYTTSAQLLGDVILGGGAKYDLGTNVISDAYIDFGVPGVVVILFAIGMLAKAIRNYAARDPHDPRRVIMFLMAMALFAELPRYAIDLPIRVLSWAWIFSFAISKLVSNRIPPDDAPTTGHNTNAARR